MASAILFLEHHDHVTLWEDADFAISVNPDYLQFMQLGPMPGTKLYEDYERQGRILENIPYEEKHGQDQIWFRHDIFSREESREILRAAFRRDYETNGASFLRAAMTTLMGVRYCRNHADARVRRREKSFVLAGDLRLLMVSSRILSENDATTELVDRIEREYEDLYGVPTWGIRAKQAAAVVFGLIEWARIRTVGDTRQPGMQVMRYGWKLRRVRAPYRWVRAAFRWVRGLSGLRDSAVTAGAE